MSREMKDSGVEWIGEIPKDWEITKIKRIARIYTGNSIRDNEKENYTNYKNSIPYIPTKAIDVNNSLIDYNNGLYIPLYNTNFKIAKKGSILLCIEGGSAGKKIAYLSQDVCFVNKLCCFKAINFNNKYLYYYIKSPAFSNEFSLHISGLIGGVSQGEIKELSITIPSLLEQEKIANFLDEKVGEINRLIDNSKKSIEEYKKYKQSVITEAVTKGLASDIEMKDTEYEYIGQIPIHWKIKKIKYILKETGERTKNGSEEPLSMSQKYGLIPTKEMDVIPNMASSFKNCKIVHKNDLVFNKLKAHLGVFAKSNYEGIVSPDYAVYQSKSNNNMLFLEYLFKTPQYISQFIKHSRGIAQGLTRLYTEELFNIFVAVPSINEQNQITEYLYLKCSEIDSIVLKKEKLISELEAYKNSTIYEYVTGKKEV